MRVCPHHNVFLVETSVAVADSKKIPAIVAAEAAVSEDKLVRQVDVANPPQKLLIDLARDVAWLLQGSDSDSHHAAHGGIVRQYIPMMLKKGFGSSAPITRCRRMVSELERFVGEMRGEDTDFIEWDKWLVRILSCNRKYWFLDPLSHLLFIHFLGHSA